MLNSTVNPFSKIQSQHISGGNTVGTNGCDFDPPDHNPGYWGVNSKNWTIKKYCHTGDCGPYGTVHSQVKYVIVPE